jgi:hypothetical protein
MLWDDVKNFFDPELMGALPDVAVPARQSPVSVVPCTPPTPFVGFHGARFGGGSTRGW